MDGVINKFPVLGKLSQLDCFYHQRIFRFRVRKFNQSSSQEFSINIQLQEFPSIKVWFIFVGWLALAEVFCSVIFHFLRNFHQFLCSLEVEEKRTRNFINLKIFLINFYCVGTDYWVKWWLRATHCFEQLSSRNNSKAILHWK